MQERLGIYPRVLSRRGGARAGRGCLATLPKHVDQPYQTMVILIHSSLLNDLKVPVKIAQEHLGHASISRTLNINTRVVDASHRKAIETLERALLSNCSQIGRIDRLGRIR